MDRNVSTTVESFTTIVENVKLVETCNRYVTAPLALAQLSIGVVDKPLALSAGAASVGGCGTETIVVKLQTFDHGPLAVVFLPLTRQKKRTPWAGSDTCLSVSEIVESLNTTVTNILSCESCNVYEVAFSHRLQTNFARTGTFNDWLGGDINEAFAGGARARNVKV
jgi:hypothetical protein